MAVIKEGLIVQRLNDILAAQREKAVQLFKDITPEGEEVDTSANTTIGRLINLSAPPMADLWEALGLINDNFDPSAAQGIALDKLVLLGGIERQRERKATCSAIVTGDAGVVIPVFSTIRATTTGLLWRTRSTVTFNTSYTGIQVDIDTVANSTVYSITYTTIDGNKVITYTSDSSATEPEISNGLIAASLLAPHVSYVTLSKIGNTQSLQVSKIDPYISSVFTLTGNMSISKYQKVVALQAEVAGNVEQGINTITSIATPVLGWDSITNFTAAAGGRGVESDSELRIRFANTKYEKATNILEALYSALINTEGVNEVVIYENDTDTTDGNGLPPHSFMPIVSGGYDTQKVAEVIWQNKPLGILSFNGALPPSTINEYVTVNDSQGFPHLIGVSQPTPISIYMEIDLDTVADVFPADGKEQIRSAIAAYMQANFGIGSDIIYSRLFTPINSVAGHSVNSFTIGTAPSPVGTTNIVLDFNELYTLDTNDIIITP